MFCTLAGARTMLMDRIVAVVNDVRRYWDWEDILGLFD